MDATQPKSPRANSKEKKQQVVPKKCIFHLIFRKNSRIKI
jgi:hypothetical protein